MKLLAELFLTFAKVGLFTFGGGYAMISIIETICVDQKKWITHEEMMELTVIAESTPGPIAVNAATFVGWRVAGFFGAALATFGVVVPSFLIILLISFLLTNFADIAVVKHAFEGIRAGVLALLVKALWTMFKKNPKGAVSYGIMAAAFVVTAFFHLPVIAVLVGCAAVGLGSSLWMAKKEGDKK
jgi:chromate transporter